MRYYLDTNILVFIVLKQRDDISCDIRNLLDDYENTFYTSTVCVQELIHLYQIGKLRVKRNRHIDILKDIEDFGIEIIALDHVHLDKFSRLPFHEEHSDPFDRAIISQAICDHIPLISSDRKFKLYECYGLDFVYNKR